MNKVCVRFLMKGGSFLNVFISEKDAQKYITEWKEGKLPKVIGDVFGLPVAWAINTDELVVMHTIDPAELQAMQAQQVQQHPGVGKSWIKGSGLN